jgi:hypothetical protein
MSTPATVTVAALHCLNYNMYYVFACDKSSEAVNAAADRVNRSIIYNDMECHYETCVVSVNLDNCDDGRKFDFAIVTMQDQEFRSTMLVNPTAFEKPASGSWVELLRSPEVASAVVVEKNYFADVVAEVKDGMSTEEIGEVFGMFGCCFDVVEEAVVGDVKPEIALEYVGNDVEASGDEVYAIPSDDEEASDLENDPPECWKRRRLC